MRTSAIFGRASRLQRAKKVRAVLRYRVYACMEMLDDLLFAPWIYCRRFDCVLKQFIHFHRPQAKIKYVFNGSRLQVEAAPSRGRVDKPRTLLNFPPEFSPTQSGQRSRNSRSNSRSDSAERLPRLTGSGNTSRRDPFAKLPATRKSHRKKRFGPTKSQHNSRDDAEKRPPISNNEKDGAGQAHNVADKSLDLYQTGPPSIQIPAPRTEAPNAFMSTNKLRSLNLTTLRRLEQVCMAHCQCSLLLSADVIETLPATQCSHL